jgi:hypothetical protein
MSSAEEAVRIYRDLAQHHDRHGQPQVRDRLLILAIDAAQAGGLTAEAESLRQKLLNYNPYHLLKPFDSYEAALKSLDVNKYVSALRRSHPLELARQQLLELHKKEEPEPVLPMQPLVPAPAQGLPKSVSDKLERRIDSRQRPPSLPAPVMAGWDELHPPPRSAMSPIPLAPEPVRERRPEPRHSHWARTPEQPPTFAAWYYRDNSYAEAGWWFSALLALVVVAAGLLWAAFTLVHPFLPPRWRL